MSGVIRSRALVLVVLAFCAGSGAAWYLARLAAPVGSAPPSRPRIEGDFTLLDSAGQPVSWSTIDRRLQLVFFGFTSCPEACPLTLTNATQALAGLGEAGAGVGLVLISVDPQRDTPPVIGAYAARFGPRLAAYTGDPAGVAAAAKAFGVYYESLPPEADGSYMVNHTATLFLLGADDSILEMIPYGTSSARIAAAVGRHL